MYRRSTDELRIPVKLLATQGRTALVLPVKRSGDCARCLGTNGCAEHPWFRGLIPDRPFRVPLARGLANAQYAQLILPGATLRTLCLLAYALPLLAFFIALVAARNLADWQQFLLALCAAGVACAAGKRFAGRLLGRHLRLVSPSVPDRAPSHCPIPQR